MKNWKKLLVLLLALVTVFAFAACGDKENEETEPTLNPGDKNCEHVFTEWEVTKERSCTKKGLKTRECEKCGREEEETLLAYGHTYYGGECSECGREAKECEHPEVDIVVMSEATCTESGEERKVCKICKAAVEINRISALWHPETTEVVISEATCTEDGEIHHICNLCGEVADIDYIWATWHSDTTVKVISEPTCTENGLSQEICNICGEVVDEDTIWSNGHSYEYIDAKNPTCTENGWYKYRKCTVCDYLYNYEERPATGHSYYADTCYTCGYVNPDFEIVTAPGVAVNTLPMAPHEQVVYTGNDVVVEKHVGNISTKGQVDIYTLNVTVQGRYVIQLKEVYSGNDFNLYLYNELNEQVASDTYCVNGDYIYAQLTVGTYTIKLVQDDGYSTYEMYVYHKKPYVDVTDYDMISDKMEHPQQIINYYFTPSVTGIYGFTFSEMLNNTDLKIAVYDHLGAEALYDSDRGNGHTHYGTLLAGETYNIRIYNDDNSVTPFNLTIGKAKEITSIDGYTGAQGTLTFDGQKDRYTFTATDTTYSIFVTGNTADLELYLRNYLGEEVTHNYYCGHGEGITVSNLKVGQVYTIEVDRRYDNVDYTLYALTQKPAFAVNSDMAVQDILEYPGQKNAYTFTVDRTGDHKILFAIHEYTNNSYISVQIYDANGNLVRDDSYVSNGDYFTMNGLTVGETYTIYVSVYSGVLSYAMSIQP